MKKVVRFLTIPLTLMITACSTMEKSVLFGSTVGFGVGAGIGGGMNPENGRLPGAAIGTLLGGLIAWDAYKKKEAKDKVKSPEIPPPPVEFSGSSNSSGNTPKLRPAQVRVRYVEDQVKDGTFIPAHFEYEIAEPAKWENGK